MTPCGVKREIGCIKRAFIKYLAWAYQKCSTSGKPQFVPNNVKVSYELYQVHIDDENFKLRQKLGQEVNTQTFVGHV